MKKQHNDSFLTCLTPFSYHCSLPSSRSYCCLVQTPLLAAGSRMPSSLSTRNNFSFRLNFAFSDNNPNNFRKLQICFILLARLNFLSVKFLKYTSNSWKHICFSGFRPLNITELYKLLVFIWLTLHPAYPTNTEDFE